MDQLIEEWDSIPTETIAQTKEPMAGKTVLKVEETPPTQSSNRVAKDWSNPAREVLQIWSQAIMEQIHSQEWKEIWNHTQSLCNHHLCQNILNNTDML